MRCVPIGVRPGLFSRTHCGRIGKTFRGDKTLERREPVLVVARAIVGFTAIGSGLELFG
jgi:hypothetical protein